MKKTMLSKLPDLIAPDKIIQMAKTDIPKRIKTYYGYRDEYKTDLYYHCKLHDNILEVAIYETPTLRMGGNRPTYELFMDFENRDYITWDVAHEKFLTAKLENLTFNNTSWFWRVSKYISKEDEEMIQTFLNKEDEGIKCIADFQNEIKRERLLAARAREVAPWDKQMEKVSDIPKDFISWGERHAVREHFIFYTYDKKGAKTGFCSYCKKEVPIAKPKHNKEGVCKCCGQHIMFKSRGKVGSFSTNSYRSYLMQKIDGGMVLRLFYFTNWFAKGNEIPEVKMSETRRVLYTKDFEPDTYAYELYKNEYMRWVRCKSYYGCNWYDNQPGAIYQRTIPSLAKNELKITGLPEMIRALGKIDPEVYLNGLRKHPYIEQLAKAGLTKLANAVMLDTKLVLEIESVKDLSKALGIDKARMKRLRKNNGARVFLEWLKYEKLKDTIIDDNVIRYFDEMEITPDQISFITDRMSEVKICNYLKKQYQLTGRNPRELLGTWNDYLAIASRCKIDVQKEIFYKPKNLIESHDEVVELSGGEGIALRAGEIANKFPDVDNICSSIKEKYEFQDKKYAIVVPDRIEDIIKEGRVLGHCLDRSDRYFERIQNKESYIVFLRKTEDIDTPYYTLEIEPDGTARQKRTTGDKQNKDYEDAVGFIKKWQKEIRNRLTEEDLLLEKESERLREEEFKELRRTNAKIRNGHMAGKLLADVLEEDLMKAIDVA